MNRISIACLQECVFIHVVIVIKLVKYGGMHVFRIDSSSCSVLTTKSNSATLLSKFTVLS